MLVEQHPVTDVSCCGKTKVVDVVEMVSCHRVTSGVRTQPCATRLVVPPIRTQFLANEAVCCHPHADDICPVDGGSGFIHHDPLSQLGDPILARSGMRRQDAARLGAAHPVRSRPRATRGTFQTDGAEITPSTLGRTEGLPGSLASMTCAHG